MGENGVVAGGGCLDPLVNYWNAANETWGGASCNNANYRILTCPSGTLKRVIHSLRNSGVGGEAALCFGI